MQRRQFLALGAGTAVSWLGGLALPCVQAASRLAAPDGAAELPIPHPGLWHNTLDPADFLVSEKLDGVRGVWDGQTLRFRSGRPVPAPAWFIAALPRFALDGELWVARHAFDTVSATLRREQPRDEEWRQVQYMIFDSPQATGNFNERITQIADVIAKAGQPWLKQIEQVRIKDRHALDERLAQVVAAGGEGLVLHRAEAQWLAAHNEDLFKLKPQLDAEATVIAHLPGKGRNAGKLGALLVETSEGQRFRIGTGFSDAQREAPPPVGSVITYRYRDLTSTGLPKFASFLRSYENL